jgi:nucleoside-diphosphate-sugar epimerase
MRIIVSGGAGCIGSHLCDHLVAAGHQTVAVDDLSLGRRANIAHLENNTNFVFREMSILEPAFESLMQAESFDAVFTWPLTAISRREANPGASIWTGLF